jgi:hypothetical protein
VGNGTNYVPTLNFNLSTALWNNAGFYITIGNVTITLAVGA